MPKSSKNTNKNNKNKTTVNKTNAGKNNIKVYKKKRHINIGIIFFGIIFVYIFFTLLIYFTTTHVTSYEVKQGSIINDTYYTGIIIRNEEVVKSKGNGYVNFFALEGDKVGAKTCVYTLSDNELNFETAASEESKLLTSEEQDSILMKIHSFNERYEESDYYDVVNLKNSITTILENNTNQSRLSQLDEMSISDDDNIKAYSADSDGIISYSVDGYEDLTVDDVDSDIIAKKNYEVSNVKDNSKVKKGDELYKVIKDNNWTIVIQITKEQYNTLKDLNSVNTEFSEDNQTATAALELEKKDDNYYAYLSYQSDMVRYSNERYISIRLILEDEQGLKIPTTSVVEKDFYEIPTRFLTKGGDDTKNGVYVVQKNGNVKFEALAIYSEDTENGYVYVNPDDIAEGTVIEIKGTTKEQYTISKNKMKKFKGVYCINKGYAVFRIINILCQSDEYYIVENGTYYGLTDYDHIALDSSTIKENESIY